MERERGERRTVRGCDHVTAAHPATPLCAHARTTVGRQWLHGRQAGCSAAGHSAAREPGRQLSRPRHSLAHYAYTPCIQAYVRTLRVDQRTTTYIRACDVM